MPGYQENVDGAKVFGQLVIQKFAEVKEVNWAVLLYNIEAYLNDPWTTYGSAMILFCNVSLYVFTEYHWMAARILSFVFANM